ncbi:MAG TPA: AIR synthase related protein [Terriglobales bacterium]|nr:AIR synthase related protein [Terriglobales bacterium]
MALPAGKLPVELLRKLLAALPPTDSSVVVGPGVGEDAAVLDLGGPELLVAKTDPITFATQHPGRYLLAVNSNDLATTGAEPRWLLVTALLPEGIARDWIEGHFRECAAACGEAGVMLVGGHTEITLEDSIDPSWSAAC